MTGLAKITVEKKNGALGGVVGSNDGESLLIVSLPTSVITTIGASVFKFADYDAFKTAIPAAVESATSPIRFETHIANYFLVSGSPLHVLLVDEAATFNTIFTYTSGYYATLTNYLRLQNGAITLIGVVLNPASVVTTVPTIGVTADLQSNIGVVQAFADSEFGLGRPVHVFLEGKKVTPTEISFLDLRTKISPNVSVVAWQNKDVATYSLSGTPTNNFMAEVGYTLGLVSASPVHQNIGRVLSGNLKYNSVAFSNGVLINEIGLAFLNNAAEKGYIFARNHAQLDGYYISDDPTCTAKTDDYAWVTRVRTINKAAIIARRVYNQRILDSVYTDPDTGLLSALTIKNFEADVENAINLEMIRNGEATAVEAYVDPAQDVLTTGEIVIDIRIVPVGVARYIVAKIGFSKVI